MHGVITGIRRWFVDHSLWEVLCWVLGGTVSSTLTAIWLTARTHLDWVTVGLAFAGGFVATLIGRRVDRRRSNSSAVEHFVWRIGFDYLPDSPLTHGWEFVKEDGAISPQLLPLLPGAPVSPGLQIVPAGWYGIEHSVSLDGKTCDTLSFAAKFSDLGRFYVFVEVTSMDGSTVVQRKWLRFRASNFAETPTSDRTGNEWGLSMTGRSLGQDWRAYDIALRENVRDAIGNQGLIYRQVLKVRLRGALSISAIRFRKTK